MASSVEPPTAAERPADRPCCEHHGPLIPARLGSRRRRLWELGAHAHCPVVGVCLPLPVVRRLVDKVAGGRALAGDYELHCGVNSECRQRNRLSEAVQKELDRRYAGALRLSQGLKTTEALAHWWRSQLQGEGVAGALWATLTHARCDALLEERVLQDIHLLQHQAGAANRADLARLEALAEENRVLARELAGAQQRCTRQSALQAQALEQAQAALVRARAELIGRDTALAALRRELAELEAAVPGLRHRHELGQQLAQQLTRCQDLERALMKTRHALEQERLLRREHRALAGAPQDSEPAPAVAPEPPVPALDARAVLCVGGRAASVPQYRQLIEQAGARFLHHDGGHEDHVTRLDPTLAAADLVICQTGCVSHDAYWRVKDHCKRTGKRCVFVDAPSSASLRRALDRLQTPEDRL